MYAVVGCSECGSYWLLADPETQDTARCQSCGTRHQTDRLKQFQTADTREAAAAARARLLADDQDEPLATATETAFDEPTETAPIDDRDYLAAHGVDAEAVEQAGDVSSGRSRSRDEILRDAVREHDTREAILSAAVADGLDREAASDLLERLVRRGEATEAGGSYRLL